MPVDNINAFLRAQLDDLKAKGLYKADAVITSPQPPGITVNGAEVINFCAEQLPRTCEPSRHRQRLA